MSPPQPSTPRGVQRLTFGMVPVAADEDTRLYLGDFCTLLGNALGTTVLPHRAPSPIALASAVHAGRVHLAWLSPTLLAGSSLVADAIPVASSVREGVASYHAVIFVAASSPIHSVDGLAGARVAWVARSSAAGYLFPRISLARQGLDLTKLFSSEAFYDSHARAAAAVFAGEADVGATFAVYRHADPTQELVSAGFSALGAARVVDVAGPIPADVIAASPTTSLAIRALLPNALRSLPNTERGRAALQRLFRVDGFEPFAPGALTELRALLTAGRELGVIAAE